MTRVSKLAAVWFAVSAVVSLAVGRLTRDPQVRCIKCGGLGRSRRPGYGPPVFDRCLRCHGTGTERGAR